jgi:hypothetical protein
MSGNYLRASMSRLLPLHAPLLLVAGILGQLIVVGCSKTSTSPVRPVPMALVAQRTGTASPRYVTAGAPSLLSGTAQGDTIPVTFTRALLVVRDVRFVFPDAADDDPADTLDVGSGENDGEGGGQARFRGPFVIDLLSGSAARLDTIMVLPGDYARVQGHLQALREGDEDAASHADLVGSTVWLEGTIEGDGGGPFSFLARIDNEFQIRGAFHVAEATMATAFVAFDLARWLEDRDGHFLDPRVAENEQAIKSAIRHGIKVGMDDDHDGEMDDAMHQAAGE